MGREMKPMKEKMKNHPYLFLAVVFTLLFLAGNELAAVTDTAESNYALTAKEMVLSGDWMSPRIYGHYWYDKPIFFYWELALSFADFGFNEFAARLPSAVFGVASVLYTFWFSSKVYDRKTGWTAALILGTSLEFWLLSKAVVTDAALFFFMSVSIASFYLGYREDRKYYFLCYAAALAVLTKGPIGLALPGLSAILFLLWRRDLREMLHVRLISGMVLFLLLCAPWYIYMTVYHGTDFLLNFFGVHNYLRATVAEHQSTAHWWFYIAMYFAGFFPWSFFMLPALFRKWKEHGLSFARADTATQFLLVWGVTVLLVFQLIATKYTTYTFPSLFAFAILTAKLLAGYDMAVERKALMTGAVYTLLVLTVVPVLTYMRSGKGPGTALASMDTGNKIIVYENKYRTSTVFYSGKIIYRLASADEIDRLKPGTLSWNAKNVMPFYSEEKLKDNKDGYFIVVSPCTEMGDTKIIEVKGSASDENSDYRRGRIYRFPFDWAAILRDSYHIG